MRVLRLRLPLLCGVLLATQAAAVSAAGPSLLLAAPAAEATEPALCAPPPGSAWPAGPLGRRASIAQMQQVRPHCLGDAGFLARLGALLLEDGDTEQALIWLERALLLDPELLGARADYALALAAQGQPDALGELAAALRGRSDVPAALRARLYPAQPRSIFAWPVIRLGHALRAATWRAQGEVSLLAGYDGNLNRSPRLSELALTLPEGVVVLPVQSQPRSGAAALGSTAVQLAYAPQASTILRTGLVAAGRAAPRHQSTDWRQWQWISGLSHAYNGARAHFDFSLAGVAGPLGEPYAVRRLALSVETFALDCRLQLGLEQERRSQSPAAALDARTDAWQLSAKCQPAPWKGWNWTLDLRGDRDRPDLHDRPGGTQRSLGTGLRLAGPVWGQTWLEITARATASRDSLGYSPLLNNNARRRMNARQLAVEAAVPLWREYEQRLDAIVKWQIAHQDSNLPLFRYQAASLYGGLRWQW